MKNENAPLLLPPPQPQQVYLAATPSAICALAPCPTHAALFFTKSAGREGEECFENHKIQAESDLSHLSLARVFKFVSFSVFLVILPHSSFFPLPSLPPQCHTPHPHSHHSIHPRSLLRSLISLPASSPLPLFFTPHSPPDVRRNV